MVIYCLSCSLAQSGIQALVYQPAAICVEFGIRSPIVYERPLRLRLKEAKPA
jgi:hypothetical protein